MTLDKKAGTSGTTRPLATIHVLDRLSIDHREDPPKDPNWHDTRTNKAAHDKQPPMRGSAA